MSAEPLSVYFVDANVLVYAYDRSAGEKHAVSAQLIEHCWENESGCLSIQVLHEFFVTVTQRIAKPLDVQTARQIVSDLAHWRLHIPDVSDLLQTIDYQQNYQLSFWDAMILQSAAHLGCGRLLSEGLNHGQRFGDVQVMNPYQGTA